MKRIFNTLALLLLLSAACQAQDTNYARYIIRQLTSEPMQGRGPSYKGDAMAANFICNELRMRNVKDLVPGYYQRFTYNTCTMEGQCWIEVGGRRLKSYDEFRVMPWSAPLINPSIPLVRIPLSTFASRDLLQAFVASHEGALAEALIYLDLTAGDALLLQRPDVQQRLALLSKRNPFGSRGIVVGMKEMHPFSVSDCDRQRDYLYVEVLSKAIPRKASTMNLCISTQYRPAYPAKNIWGVIPGESDSMIVVAAHYDHLGTMGDGYKYMKQGQLYHEGAVRFPGAHDNASGVAAALDIARMYQNEKPRYTLVFLFLAGEEAGLKGSTYAAEHPPLDFSMVKLLINLDLFCGGDEGLMVFNAESPATRPYFDRLKRLNDILQVAPEVRPRKNAPNSDHYPFSSLCPSIYILTMGQPYGGYHDPYDRCEACGLQHYHNYLLLVSSLLM